MDVAKNRLAAADRQATAGQDGLLFDLAETARLWRLVCRLGWMDIGLRYRGSWLGPFWFSLSTAIMIAALGTLYPLLFHLPARDYVPYLAVSLVLWNALVHVANDACGIFVQQEATILSVRLPLFVHVGRVLVRNLIALAHQAIVPLAVLLLFGVPPGADAWSALPALALWMATACAFIFILGALSARFRDLPPIVASTLQLAFFVTPVIWRAEQLGADASWLVANPLHALLDILRAPLLGQTPAPASWPLALGFAAAAVGIAATTFALARRRLAFWL